MELVIGIDEAGYGPNLGPLVIVASLWTSSCPLAWDQVLSELEPEFRSLPWTPDCPFLPLGDSKQIYRPGGNLQGLQAGLRFLHRQCSTETWNAYEWIHSIADQDMKRIEQLPWYAAELQPGESAVEVTEDQARVQCAAQRKWNTGEWTYQGMRARILDEREFNAALSRLGNKANVLSHYSIELAAEAWRSWLDAHPPSSPLCIRVLCDRHGGRKRYASLLASRWREDVDWIDIVEETPHCSRYFGLGARGEIQAQFQVRGDSWLPSAVASMAAKWARECLMHRLNAYWSQVLNRPLRPTAGYPVDAKRFAEEISEAATQLGFPREAWWRAS